MKAGCACALASCMGLLPPASCITSPGTDALFFQLAPGIGTRRCRGQQPKVSSSTSLQQVRSSDRLGAVSCSDRSRDGGRYPAATLRQQWQSAKGEGLQSQREGGLPVSRPSADGRIAGGSDESLLSAGLLFPIPPPSSSTAAAKDSPPAVRREDGEPVLGGTGSGRGRQGSVFDRDGYTTGGWERQQQQQQQQQQQDRMHRASGGRVNADWRKGSQRSLSPRMHTTTAVRVRINGDGSASGGSGWKLPTSLPSPPRTHRRRHSRQRQPQQHLASIRCLWCSSTTCASGGRRGTALSMATPSADGSGADSSFPSRGRGGTKRPAGDESPAARPAERRNAGESTAPATSADELASTPPDQAAAATQDRNSSRSTTAVGEGIDIASGLPAALAVPRKEIRANKSSALMPTDLNGQSGSNLLEASGEGGADFAEEDFDGPIAESYARGRWLLGLLVLQSSSSFVLDHYQDLLREHVVVTLFLTMLVGAGGNAGNQSAIKVIRGLATGRFTPDAACALRVIGDQAIVGILLGAALAAGGFVRVWVTEGTNLRDASAISSSLFLIVMASVLLGSALPFGFARAGVDPANAGTTIQVAMDIVGVAVTCVTCSLVLTQLNQALPL